MKEFYLKRVIIYSVKHKPDNALEKENTLDDINDIIFLPSKFYI